MSLRIFLKVFSNLLHWQWYVKHTQTNSSFYCNKFVFQDEPLLSFQTLKDLKHDLQTLFLSNNPQKVQSDLDSVYNVLFESYDAMRKDITRSVSYITVSFETVFS